MRPFDRNLKPRTLRSSCFKVAANVQNKRGQNKKITVVAGARGNNYSAAKIGPKLPILVQSTIPRLFIIKSTCGKINTHANHVMVRLVKNARLLNAHRLYGSALQDGCGDIYVVYIRCIITTGPGSPL